jgi:pimeloyl-ACP methyl ester carboxylesterase
MYWLLEDLADMEAGAGRAIVEEWADNAFLAMRSFKPRRVVPPTVLEDAELQGIKVPALFLVGENEKIYSAQKAVQRLNKVAPRIRTDIIPRAGHDLTIVQAEVVNRKVLDFLLTAQEAPPRSPPWR